MRNDAIPRTALLLAGGILLLSCGGDGVAPEVSPDLVITTTSLEPAVRGSTYAAAVTAAGGDGAYTWSVTAGALPPGLALTVEDLGDDDAIITGVPEADGSFTFTVQVRSGDGQTASEELTLEVLPRDPLAIETPAIPPALAGASYNVGLSAQGGDGQTFEWVLVEGSLPAGIELTAAGRIRGTPQAPDTAAFTVEVRSDGHTDRMTYSLAVVPNRTDEFNITIFPVVEVPEGVQPHLDSAVAQWERAITDNFQALTIPTLFWGPDACAGFGKLTNGTSLDDILIIVNIAPIESPDPGRVILGQAGPCEVRDTINWIPWIGVVTLNSDVLIPLIGSQTLTHIIAHEIAHVLGFGSVWQLSGLLDGAGTADSRFVGEHAVAEYNALGGSGTVPVESQGGEGTRDSHWRLSDFGNELMVPSIGNQFMPLSRVSIASFRDIGYTVDLGAADDYSLAAALAAGGGGDHHHWVEVGYDEVLREPLRGRLPNSDPGALNPDRP